MTARTSSPPVGLEPDRHVGVQRADVRAILFDRDDTLIVDVPYNGDPALVRPMPGAIEAVRRARAAGVSIGVVSNQSGIARGLLGPSEVERVNRRVDEIFGGFDVWRFCPHGPDGGCACRKPRPGMVLSAVDELGVPASKAAVIGDIGADVGAAAAAGAIGVLVPTRRTLRAEVEAAPIVSRSLAAAVSLLVERGPA